MGCPNRRISVHYKDPSSLERCEPTGSCNRQWSTLGPGRLVYNRKPPKVFRECRVLVSFIYLEWTVVQNKHTRGSRESAGTLEEKQGRRLRNGTAYHLEVDWPKEGCERRRGRGLDSTGFVEARNPREPNHFLDLKEYKKGVWTNVESKIHFAMKVIIGLSSYPEEEYSLKRSSPEQAAAQIREAPWSFRYLLLCTRMVNFQIGWRCRGRHHSHLPLFS